MTIDEAITHAREVSSRKFDDMVHCIRCSEFHKQLAEWLEELKALRNGLSIKCDNLNEALEKGKNIGYNKAIDDFIEKVELKYLGVHPDELYEKYYPREICKQIKELAEQLKVGVKNENNDD